MLGMGIILAFCGIASSGTGGATTDCVLTTWSTWSTCTALVPCSADRAASSAARLANDADPLPRPANQRRTRQILKKPVLWLGGKPCPPRRFETKPCFAAPCMRDTPVPTPAPPPTPAPTRLPTPGAAELRARDMARLELQAKQTQEIALLRAADHARAAAAPSRR